MINPSLSEACSIGVKCAWCGKVLRSAATPAPVTVWSHGICGGCRIDVIEELRAGTHDCMTPAAVCHCSL